MKYRAVVGTKDSYIKTEYERLLQASSNNEGACKLIEMFGGIENVYSKITFNDKDSNILVCIAKIERDDEYEYFFFCKKDFGAKEEIFGDFTRELSKEEFLEICQQEDIELGEM